MLEFIDCASAIRARYQLQVLLCQQQAERQARLTKRSKPEVVEGYEYEGPMLDLVIGTVAIAACVHMSQATTSRRLRAGLAPVVKIMNDCGRPSLAVRRSDLHLLRRPLSTKGRVP